MIAEWKGLGRKRLWHNWGSRPACAWRHWVKLLIVGVQTSMRSRSRWGMVDLYLSTDMIVWARQWDESRRGLTRSGHRKTEWHVNDICLAVILTANEMGHTEFTVFPTSDGANPGTCLITALASSSFYSVPLGKYPYSTWDSTVWVCMYNDE
jgi:hypothetical protein